MPSQARRDKEMLLVRRPVDIMLGRRVSHTSPYINNGIVVALCNGIYFVLYNKRTHALMKQHVVEIHKNIIFSILLLAVILYPSYADSSS